MKKHLLYIIFLSSFQQVFAQKPALIQDKTTFGNFVPSQDQALLTLGVVEPTLIFAADDGINGKELWRSGGTNAGTLLVKDINTGVSNSNPRYFCNLDASTVLFSANYGIHSTGLWKTNGTEAGTELVKQIGISFKKMAAYNSMVYFIVNLNELWKTNGTDAGTVLVKNILDGYILNLVPCSNAFYFTTHSDETEIDSIWKSDGTEVGTVLVKEFDKLNFTEDNTISGNQFFVASDGISGSELWKTDGTTAGTVLVKDIVEGSIGASLSYLTVFNNLIYFKSSDSIWKSDGTEAGTVEVSALSGYGMENIGGKLYFFDYNYSNNNTEIWVSDNTATNFTLLKSFEKFDNNSWNPHFVGTANGVVYFNAKNKNNGEELWGYTPNTSDAILVSDIRPGIYGSKPQNIILAPELPDYPNSILFWANDGINGYELYRYRGIIASPPTLAKDIEPNTFSSNPTNFTQLNNFFIYTSEASGSGGASVQGGIYSINTSHNLSPISLSKSNTSNFHNFNNRVYFQANGGGSIGNELYSTNGVSNSVANTAIVLDIYAGASSSNPAELTTVGNNFFFAASDATNGRELWKSDGTAAGTVLVKNIRNATNDSSPNHLIEFGGFLYFFANQDGNPQRLWKSNGTNAGTVPFSTSIIVNDSSDEINKTSNNLFISCSDNSNDIEMYVSNGNFVSQLKNINPSGSSNPAHLTPIGNILYFTANDGTNGTELWKTDGTLAGTVMVKNINEQNAGANSNPKNLYNFNGVLYFSAKSGDLGEELWKSDGTEAGTVLVKNINPTINSNSTPANFCKIGNSLYFSATHPEHGRELWKTDGTPEGTVLVYDLFENYNSENNNANPKNLFNMNGKLFFSAKNGINGEELFVFTPCPLSEDFNQHTYTQSSTYHVTEDITAVHNAQYGKVVNYFAGESILLSPGFSVSANDAISTNKNVFRAEIRGCN